MDEHVFGCHVTLIGQFVPQYHAVTASTAAEAKAKIKQAAVEQGVQIKKITAKKVW